MGQDLSTVVSKVIDSSHESVTSNITTVEMRRDLRLLSEVAEYAIDFGNQFHINL